MLAHDGHNAAHVTRCSATTAYPSAVYVGWVRRRSDRKDVWRHRTFPGPCAPTTYVGPLHLRRALPFGGAFIVSRISTAVVGARLPPRHHSPAPEQHPPLPAASFLVGRQLGLPAAAVTGSGRLVVGLFDDGGDAARVEISPIRLAWAHSRMARVSARVAVRPGRSGSRCGGGGTRRCGWRG